MKPTIQNRTADALLFHLGHENARPIMRSVVATALDMLDAEAKADLVQFLTADQSAAIAPIDTTRCAVHTWFHPEPGQPCCWCVDGGRFLSLRSVLDRTRQGMQNCFYWDVQKSLAKSSHRRMSNAVSTSRRSRRGSRSGAESSGARRSASSRAPAPWSRRR